MTEYIKMKNFSHTYPHPNVQTTSSNSSSSSALPYPNSGYPYQGLQYCVPVCATNWACYPPSMPIATGVVHHTSSFNSGRARLLPKSKTRSSSFSSSLLQKRASKRDRRRGKGKPMDKSHFNCFTIPTNNDNTFQYLNNNNNVYKNKNYKPKPPLDIKDSLPTYPGVLPNAHGYTSFSRLQPPDGVNYREPPILNDKFFPRDPPWNEEMGVPFGAKAPHLQLRGIIVETRGPSGVGWTPLLDGISIEVKGGELMAIMSTSENEGTCLLDLIGGKSRSCGGRWRGDFILNGNLVSPSKVNSRAAYVRQDVNFCPDMSVRQTMLLHSSLRECSEPSRIIHIKAKINALIEDLGLEQVKHTRVKDLTLSEKRRLNAACHLLLETDIVLLDQPTKGMDIFDTFFLVEYLRQWAARGRIVILTIQPPTYEIFTMISRVALISTGRLMYFGKRREMLPYFAYIEYPCPAYKNPSDYYIDLVTLDDLSAEAMLESSQRVEMLAETFRRRQEPLSDPGPQSPLPPKIKHSNLCIQLLFLWIRAMIYQFPYNMLHFLGQALVAAIMSVITGAVFLNLRNPAEMDQSNINNRVAFYYYMSCIGIWPLLLMSISEAWRDKPAIERDISDGLYSRAIYVITKMCYSFPTTVLVYLAYTLPAYTMMAGFSGNTEESHFYLYVGYQLLYLLAIRGLILASTVIFDSRNRAAMLSGLIMTVVSFGAGFTIHPKDISLWASPTLWWSPARWFMREMIFEEFNKTTQPFTCSRNPVDRGDIVKKVECGIETSGQAIRYFGLSDEHLMYKFYPAVFIFGFNIVFILIYFLGFILGKRTERSKRYKVE